MKPRTLVGLVVCNLIWSFHPTMGKLVLAEVSSTTGAWARYTLSFLTFAIAARLLGATRDQAYFRPTQMKDFTILATLGFMTFCFSPLLQMLGLSGSRATDGALIIAMEPMIAVILAWLFLKERISRFQLGAFGIALGGFSLLSGLSLERVSGGLDSRLGANLLLLLSLCGEATYSVAGKSLIQRHSPMRVFGSASLLGALFITLAALIILGPGFLGELPQLTWKGWLGLLWLGPLGTAATYLFWMFALSQASVASLSLTLFIQPLCGALWGYWLLGDRLNSIQMLGGALILGAVFAETLRHLSRPSLPKETT
jgi:drug/metabolite transporter (DMT)-like permease